MYSAHSLGDSFGHSNRFCALAQRLTRIAAEENYQLVPYTHPSAPLFSRLNEEVQLLIIKQLEITIMVCEDVHTRGERLRDPGRFAWAFFKHLALTPPSDLGNRIHHGCLFEVYNTHHQLLFASLEFFEVCSYSLEDLYCRPWMDLFVRENQEIGQTVLKLVEDMVEGEYLVTTDLNHLPAHVVRESSAPDLRWVEIQPRFFSPVFAQGRVAGYLCANEIMTMSIDCKSTKDEKVRNRLC